MTRFHDITGGRLARHHDPQHRDDDTGIRPRTSRRPGRVAAHVAVAVMAFVAGAHLTRASHHTERIASDASTTPTDAAVPTETGAVAAGARFATIISQLVELAPVDAKALLANVATIEFAPVLAAQVDEQLTTAQSTLAALPGHSVLRQAVLAVHLDTYTDTRAQVSAWVMTSLAQPGTDAPPLAVFSIQTVTLAWDATQWRLADASAQPGPTPLLSGDATDAAAYTTRLDGYSDWRPA